MINPMRLVQMVKKWQKLASSDRRRISSYMSQRKGSDSQRGSKSVANRGHFVVYTRDEKRFVIPLDYLKTTLFIELFKMSEDEFGLPGDGPITLSCDAIFMENIISLARRRVSAEIEKDLLNSIANNRCFMSSSFSQQNYSQPRLLHSC